MRHAIQILKALIDIFFYQEVHIILYEHIVSTNHICRVVSTINIKETLKIYFLSI